MRNRCSVRIGCRTSTAGLLLAVVITPCAGASVISIESDPGTATEGIGSFTGSLQYIAGDFGDTGTLHVSLTNTSDAANGGYLTGFAFNIGSGDSNAFASLVSASHSLQAISKASAAPFGTYDAGAAIGGNWTGGGRPHGGIAVNSTGDFEFLITANDAGSLNAASFLDSGNGFAVRFRGFTDGGSDKVLGLSPTSSTSAVPGIPAPAAMSLLLMAGLITSRRRRA